MRCALPAPSRVALPDCSAGWRRNSQSGVGRETPGHSTSSLQTRGSIHTSAQLHNSTSLPCSQFFSMIWAFLHIHGRSGYAALWQFVFSKRKTLVNCSCEFWNDILEISSQHLLLSVYRKRLSFLLDKKRILNVAFDWHPIMLTIMAKCYLPQHENSIFSVLPISTAIPSHILTSEVSFICTFLPCQGWVSRSGGRKGVSPTECCVLSQPRAESLASHPPSPPLPSLLLPFWGFDRCLSAVCLEDVAVKATPSNTLAPACHHGTATC